MQQSRRKKVILILDNSLDTTGAFKAILAKIEPLRGQFQFVFIIPSESKNGEYLSGRGIRYYTLNFLEIRNDILNNLRYIPKLLINSYKLSRIAKKEQCSIIQVNDLYNLCGIGTKLFTRINVITHIRRMPNSFPLPIYKLWVFIHKLLSDKILPVSKANGAIFGAIDKLEILYDPLPEDSRCINYDQTLNSPSFTFLYLANYNYGKGQNHALEAFRKFQHITGAENVRLRFVGGVFNLQKNIDYKSKLQETARKLNIEDRVIFDGKSEDIFGVLKDSDVMLNFSDSESFSRVSLEALYYGIPLIATDVGGTREMFNHLINGWLVPPKNTDEMSKAMVRLYAEPNLRKEFSEGSKSFVRENFTLEVISKQLKRIYFDLSNQ